MTKLSRWRVDPEKMGLFLDDFWAAIASLETKEEVKNFFNEILTPTERKMLAKRFQAVMMLLLGYNYASIKNRLRISEATIGKISNWIEEERETLIGVAKRILALKKKKKEEIEGVKTKRHTRGDLLSSVASEIANSALKTLAKRKKKLSILK